MFRPVLLAACLPLPLPPPPPRRVENNHKARRRAFGPHFWTSLLDLTAAAGGGGRLPVCKVRWPQVGGSGVPRASPPTILKKKSTSKKPELTNLQPKTLRNWTSLSASAAVHFFGPRSSRPFGPHWSPTRADLRESLYKSCCACPNWTSLLRVKNSF